MLKAVFLDFDDTLIVHDPFKVWDSDTFNQNVCNHSNNYARSKMNPEMYKFLDSCAKAGTPIFGLSWCNNSLVVDNKQEYLNAVYPRFSIKMIGVSSPEEKVKCLCDWCKAKDIKPHEVIFVDDMYSTVNAVQDTGFIAISASALFTYGADYVLSGYKQYINYLTHKE